MTAKALGVFLALAADMGTARAVQPAGKDVVLIGTIVQIDEMREEFSVDHLAITVRVDKVISGKLKGATINFVLPAFAGDRLQVRGTYQIQAKRTPDGYQVGESDIRTIEAAPGAKPSKDLLLVVTVTAMKQAHDLKRPLARLDEGREDSVGRALRPDISVRGPQPSTSGAQGG